MTTILSRIQEIAVAEGINIGTLERKIGASKGVLSRAIKNGTDIQSKWIQVIVENYPKYSAQWLLTGEGEMLRTTPQNPPSKTPKTPTLEQPSSNPRAIPTAPDTSHDSCPAAAPTHSMKDSIPLIPISAMAGVARGETGVMDYECERYIVPAFRNADYLIQVSGDSMQPHFLSGDIVACKNIPLSDIFFQWNRTYVLDTTQGALIKRIRHGSDADHLLIVSDNPDYPPYELHRSQINAIALVLGLIRLE